MKRVGAGEADLLTRRLAGVHDPVALFAALEAEGRAQMLFRRTGGRALILCDSAVTLEATGAEACFAATSEAGRLLLPVLAERLAEYVVEQGDARLALRFERSDDPDEARRGQATSALDALRALARGAQSRDPEEPFALAALGIIGFDHVDMMEALPARPQGDFPDLYFQLAETLILIEENGAARVLALAVGSDDEAAAHRQQSLAAERLARTVARIEQARVPSLGEAPSQEARSDMDDAEFGASVLKLKEHIAAGDIFQAVPSRSFTTGCDDALSAFRRLVKADPSAYHFYLRTPYGTLLGASPETAVEVSGRRVAVSPIAGTRPRGDSADADDRQEADLRLDQKEVAEHLMLVDLARNDVARVAAPGTRRVTSLLRVERFAKVMHLVSTVEGELPEGRDAVDAIRTCMNVGTLSGAPKLKAIELIRSVETKARGPYGGAVGYLTGRGEMDSAVVIRSALVRDGMAEVRSGAGVVADSCPKAEAAETRAKASAVLAALGAAA
ncbi:anthranilate synthase component 1 [Sphingomicrobium flavum]|uniref:anthranilate synthase component 1 n=1 Tax=Sphingomicrobium flavum TaxID=1229164 RepID=UPI0021AE19B3|nr:anthranilate synthase component 1 [Sphingomicrobium flavum]